MSVTASSSTADIPLLGLTSSASNTIITTSGSDDTVVIVERVKATTHCRVICVDDEDSRECPSQGASEIERDDLYNLGFDERHNHRGGVQTKHFLYTMMYNRRVSGLRRNNLGSFRERRDANSFDSHDTDTEDESARNILFPPRCGLTRKHELHQQHSQQQHPQGKHYKLASIFVDEAGRKTLADSTNNIVNDENSNKNKRKNPSPVVGLEPAPVSVAPLCDDDEIMSTDNDDATLSDEIDEDDDDDDDDSSAWGYENGAPPLKDGGGGDESDDNNMLPSPARRISLSPVSRRLALQFDSISFFSPVKPSRTKRRKTFDTSAICL